MEPEDFARLLANRLRKIVPPGFHIEVTDGMLWYSSDPDRFPGQQNDFHVGRTGVPVRENLQCHESIEEGIVGVAEQALDWLQDYIDEATHDPWPGATRPPQPHAEIQDSALFMWYQDGAELILACDPIPLPNPTPAD